MKTKMMSISYLLTINILIILISANGIGMYMVFSLLMYKYLYGFSFSWKVYGQTPDRTTNFPYVDDSFIMDNYENFEEMVKTPLDRGKKFKFVSLSIITHIYVNFFYRTLFWYLSIEERNSVSWNDSLP